MSDSQPKIDRRTMAQRVEALLPDECWVTRTAARCTDYYIGATFANGATWTEDMCCLPCRVRGALDGPL